MQDVVLVQLLINTTAIVSYLLENGRPKGDAYKALEKCLETSVQLLQGLSKQPGEVTDGSKAE